MERNDLSYQVRGVLFRVHAKMGPGLLESVYEHAVLQELLERGLSVERHVAVPFQYMSYQTEVGFRLDLLVENEIVLEIKSVEVLNPVHFKQLLTYLRLSNKKLGFLVNFNVNSLKDKESIVRVVNGY
ncbi:MAG: GxxExxY protein [Lewinellaceae bacterium]|nr:GxxExxY protein [Lewinellaceae bacterium]